MYDIWNNSYQISILVVSQIRLAHTDVQVPDFDYYRRKELKDHTVSSREGDAARKASSYMVLAGKF